MAPRSDFGCTHVMDRTLYKKTLDESQVEHQFTNEEMYAIASQTMDATTLAALFSLIDSAFHFQPTKDGKKLPSVYSFVRESRDDLSTYRMIGLLYAQKAAQDSLNKPSGRTNNRSYLFTGIRNGLRRWGEDKSETSRRISEHSVGFVDSCDICYEDGDPLDLGEISVSATDESVLDTMMNNSWVETERNGKKQIVSGARRYQQYIAMENARNHPNNNSKHSPNGTDPLNGL